MAQDLRELCNTEGQDKRSTSMPKGHEARFLSKLEETFPEHSIKKSNSVLWRIAASIVILIGLGFATFKYVNPTEMMPSDVVTQDSPSHETSLKSLGDVSPDLKKIEHYYLANINLELSKVKLTEDNKELFDGYVFRLAELNKEYKKLSLELTENGPNELTVSALIDNLKLRLNLLYRLKEQLGELNSSTETSSSKNIS